MLPSTRWANRTLMLRCRRLDDNKSLGLEWASSFGHMAQGFWCPFSWLWLGVTYECVKLNPPCKVLKAVPPASSSCHQPASSHPPKVSPPNLDLPSPECSPHTLPVRFIRHNDYFSAAQPHISLNSSENVVATVHHRSSQQPVDWKFSWGRLVDVAQVFELFAEYGLQLEKGSLSTEV